MSPRGLPDGGYSSYQLAGQGIDPSNIYSMLWGFSPIDGQGRLVYLDTFNNGLVGWMPLQTGAGLAPKLYSQAAAISSGYGIVFSPPNSVIMKPGVVAGDRSMLMRSFLLGYSGRLGIEAAVDIEDTNPNYLLKLEYQLTGTTGQQGNIRFSHADGAWQIFNNSGWISFYSPGVMPTIASRSWVQIKLVMDMSLNKYVRAFVGDKAFDLSQYDLYPASISNGYLGRVYSEVRADSYGAGCGDGLLGYVMFTKDEP